MATKYAPFCNLDNWQFEHLTLTKKANLQKLSQLI